VVTTASHRLGVVEVAADIADVQDVDGRVTGRRCAA
jgi:hypothetical protein